MLLTRSTTLPSRVLSSADRAYALGNTSVSAGSSRSLVVSASSTVCPIIGLPRLGLQSRPARRARGTQDTFKAWYSCRVHAPAQRVGHTPKFGSAVDNIRFCFFSRFCAHDFSAFVVELARPYTFPHSQPSISQLEPSRRCPRRHLHPGPASQNRQTRPNPWYRGENVTDPPGHLNDRNTFGRCPVRPCMLQPSLHLRVGRPVDRNNETAVSLPNDPLAHGPHISAGLQMFEIPHNRLATAAVMIGQRLVTNRHGQPPAFPRFGKGSQNVVYFHLARIQMWVRPAAPLASPLPAPPASPPSMPLCQPEKTAEGETALSVETPPLCRAFPNPVTVRIGRRPRAPRWLR